MDDLEAAALTKRGESGEKAEMRGAVDGLSPMGARTAIMVRDRCYLSCGTTDQEAEGRLMPAGEIALGFLLRLHSSGLLE